MQFSKLREDLYYGPHWDALNIYNEPREYIEDSVYINETLAKFQQEIGGVMATSAMIKITIPPHFELLDQTAKKMLDECELEWRPPANTLTFFYPDQQGEYYYAWQYIPVLQRNGVIYQKQWQANGCPIKEKNVVFLRQRLIDLEQSARQESKLQEEKEKPTPATPRPIKVQPEKTVAKKETQSAIVFRNKTKKMTYDNVKKELESIGGFEGNGSFYFDIKTKT